MDYHNIFDIREQLNCNSEYHDLGELIHMSCYLILYKHYINERELEKLFAHSTFVSVPN